MHAMNALKVVLGGVINGVATFTFIATGAIVWREGAVMNGGRRDWRLFRRALRAAIAAKLDSRVCDRSSVPR